MKRSNLVVFCHKELTLPDERSTLCALMLETDLAPLPDEKDFVCLVTSATRHARLKARP